MEWVCRGKRVPSVCSLESSREASEKRWLLFWSLMEQLNVGLLRIAITNTQGHRVENEHFHSIPSLDPHGTAEEWV